MAIHNSTDNSDSAEAVGLKNGTLRYPSGGAPPQPFRVVIPHDPEPILTERLCLRPMKPEHVEGLFVLHSGDEYKKFDERFEPHTSLEQTKAWMARKTFTAPPAAAGRSYQFVICERADPTERIIGSIGFNQLVPLPNVGFGLLPEVWGRGYGTEALKGLLKAWWALPRDEPQANGEGGGDGSSDKGAGSEKVYANCNKINLASFRVLTKAGFKVYHELVLDDGACLCLSVGADD